MGASFSTWARWDDTVVQRVVAEQASAQASGTALIQGVRNLTISGGVLTMNNFQRACSPQDSGYLRMVLDFLSLVNFRSIQLENLGKWTPGTVRWLLEGELFQWWLATQCAILWGTGMPGAGKTILASVVIDYLENLAQTSGDVCIAFVYCRYTEPMAVRNILAALVRQLVERFPHLLSAVEPLYTKHGLHMTKPTQRELLDVIRSMCSCFRIAYFFIDGLDEALDDQQFDLLDTLKSIKANFFITSRPLVRLEDVLPNAEFFDIAAQNEDVELLVAQHIDRNPSLRQILVTDEARQRVIQKICQSSCGMFLQASLMVELVSRCTNLRSIMDRVEELPPKLDVLYDETLQRIEMQGGEQADLAKRVLTWVVYAFSPLSTQDLQYAIASDPNVDWSDPQNLVPESILVSACCGLVVVEERTWQVEECTWKVVERSSQPEQDPLSEHIVRLVHYTALDILKRLLGLTEPSPHCQLTETCIRRLIHSGITSSGHLDVCAYELSFILHPLLKYAYQSWHLHVKESIPNPNQPGAQPLPCVLDFLAMSHAFPALLFEESGHMCGIWDILTLPIHLITFYRLSHLFPFVSPLVNAITHYRGGSALSIAAYRNDRAAVELLLQIDDINVNLSDKCGDTALLIATKEGHANMVAFLLRDPRIAVRERNQFGLSALHCAFMGSHTEVAIHLLATPDIDVNVVDKNGHTPLMLAYDQPLWLLDALIDHPDIDLDLKDNDGLTPLMHACLCGSSAAVQWYLRLPGITTKDNSGATALIHRARHYPGVETNLLQDFRALRDAGLDANDKDIDDLIALAHAVHNSDQSIVEGETITYFSSAQGLMSMTKTGGG